MAYESWTPQDVANKADWEGGIYELIRWGGPEIFTCLGPAAVEAARVAEQNIEAISAMLPEPGMEDWEDYE